MVRGVGWGRVECPSLHVRGDRRLITDSRPAVYPSLRYLVVRRSVFTLCVPSVPLSPLVLSLMVTHAAAAAAVFAGRNSPFSVAAAAPRRGLPDLLVPGLGRSE